MDRDITRATSVVKGTTQEVLLQSKEGNTEGNPRNFACTRVGFGGDQVGSKFI